MVRVLSTTVICLAMQLLLAGLHASEAPGSGAPPKTKAKLDVTIRLQFSRETPYTEVKKVLDGLQPLNVKQILLRVPAEGKDPSAEVIADPAVPSTEVGTVVGRLLELGIRKVSIEVKK